MVDGGHEPAQTEAPAAGHAAGQTDGKADGKTDGQAEAGKPRRKDPDDAARDALHIMPLDIIPLETPGLQHARLIKNVRLETVIEMFNDAQTGSGQVFPNQVSSYFESYKDEVARDLVKINKIAAASSFDVYTSRIELRRLNIEIKNHRALSLSDSKKAELTRYMTVFTRPLIEHIYGSEELKVQDVDDLIKMFSSPNRDEALKNLQKMAEKLDVTLLEIPKFLEEYGDIFLSLAYFKRCLDAIVPEVEKFLAWMGEIRNTNEIKRDFRQIKMLDEINHDLTDISASITGRFESFDNRSKDFWNDINAETFRQIRDLITSHHVTIGGVLCGLAVKIDLWKTRFARGGGGPLRRLEFVKSEILPGLSHIKALEQSAARGG
jgi:transposase-like protein